MASKCYLDRLPDEMLLHILDLVMTRDAPFYIENSCSDERHPILRCGQSPPPPSREAADARRPAEDPNFSTKWSHRRDWLRANGVSRRPGCVEFFRNRPLVVAGTWLVDPVAIAADESDRKWKRLSVSELERSNAN